MSTVRLLVGGVGLALVTLGSLASLYAFLLGDPAAYSRGVDSSPVPVLATLVLFGAVGLAFVPNPDGGQS